MRHAQTAVRRALRRGASSIRGSHWPPRRPAVVGSLDRWMRSCGRESRRQFGLERRIGATGPTAQTVVVEFDQVGDVRQQRPDRLIDALDVSEMTRILHDDPRSAPPTAGGSSLTRSASHSLASTTRSANRAAARCRRSIRSPSTLRRTPPSSRRSQRRRASTPSHGGESDRLRRAARRARASAPQHAPPDPGTRYVAPVAAISSAVAWWVERCHASMTQPVNNQTSSPVEVIAGGRRSGSCDRPSRDGTSLTRCATANTDDPASRSR